jgi:hypothetical protein
LPSTARLALTCAAVEPGVAWDTSAVPAGNYAIYGYTFEPAVNVWTRRTGVVQVVDDASAPLPVAALTSVQGEATAYEQSTVSIAGCAMGPQGTIVTLAWAPITAADLADENTWVPFAELAATPEPAPFALDLDPPTEAAGQAIVLRARAQDASGRSWTDVASGVLLVYPGAGTSDPATGPLVPDACGSANASSGSTEDATSDGAETSTRACGCDADRGRLGFAWLVFALGLRRRGRCAKVPGPCTGASSCVTDGSGWCSRTTGSSWSSRSR